MSCPRFAFAGDRSIAVEVLDYLLTRGDRPLALLLTGSPGATHADVLRRACSFLPEDRVFDGKLTENAAERLAALDLDYLVCVHYPYLIPKSILDIPSEGVINLHPAYLPFNRGWHTPSWAILDDTPIGATVHFMDEGVDTGPVISQTRVAVGHGDTAHRLYQKVLAAELELFKQAWPDLVSRRYRAAPQKGPGTQHRKTDLLSPAIQEIDLNEPTTPGALLQHLRALTTSDIAEAAYYEIDGRRFRVQVSIEEEELPQSI